MYKLSSKSLKHLEGVDPILIDILKEAVKESPYDFGIPITGGLRTEEMQYALYVKGLSKCDGTRNKSYHQTGKAFDIYGYVYSKASWDKRILTKIARHIQKVAYDVFCVELQWGGDWVNFKDMPHFQIK